MAYRYLGNKTRISDWIADIVMEKLPQNSRIADPMCGTASMSEAFADRGLQVVASDQLKFPILHAKARLQYAHKYDFSKVAMSYESAIEKLNSLETVKGLFWNEYSEEGLPVNGAKPRKYFTGENASKIDAIRAKILEWRSIGLNHDACDLLLHDLILAVNDVANIAGTYGYYRSSWNKSSLKSLELKVSKRVSYSNKHIVLQGKVEEVASNLNVNACYLDPPYTKRQYGGNYHILETLAQEDTPIPAGEGGLRDWSPQASDYCYKRHVRTAFHKTIKELDVRWIFLSYSEDGHIPQDELLDLLGEYGSVERLTMPLERYRSNANVNKKGQVNEHLYILEKYYG
jgi:adenine-specific DNA-methyltransferase